MPNISIDDQGVLAVSLRQAEQRKQSVAIKIKEAKNRIAEYEDILAADKKSLSDNESALISLDRTVKDLRQALGLDNGS